MRMIDIVSCRLIGAFLVFGGVFLLMYGFEWATLPHEILMVVTGGVIFSMPEMFSKHE